MKSLDQYNIQDLVKEAERKAKQFQKDGLKTNQIRNLYSEINRMRLLFDADTDANLEQIERQLIMLQPKLAYAAGRQHAVRRSFYPFLKAKIEETIAAPGSGKKEALQNFFLLVESIVSFHKFHGGK